MKKLILLFVLFPMFSFSQMLLENVETLCYYKYDKSKNTKDCFETLANSKIYIESDYIVFDIGVSKEKYKIIDIFKDSESVQYIVKSGSKTKTIFKKDFGEGFVVVYLMTNENDFLVYKKKED